MQACYSAGIVSPPKSTGIRFNGLLATPGGLGIGVVAFAHVEANRGAGQVECLTQAV